LDGSTQFVRTERQYPIADWSDADIAVLIRKLQPLVSLHAQLLERAAACGDDLNIRAMTSKLWEMSGKQRPKTGDGAHSSSQGGADALGRSFLICGRHQTWLKSNPGAFSKMLLNNSSLTTDDSVRF